MGEMRDSDWSRPKILRSDWLGLIGAIMTTYTNIKASYLPQSWLLEKAFSQAKRILVLSRYKDGTMQPKVRYEQQCYM